MVAGKGSAANKERKNKIMKKLVVAAVAIAMAVAAQAAQVTWSANTIAVSGTSTAYYAIMVDVTGLTGITADSVAKSIMDDTFTGKTVYGGAATYNATKNNVAVAFAKKNTVTAYANGAAIDYMTVVFDAATAADAKNYIVTSGDSPVSSFFSAAGLLTVQQGSQAGKTWTAAVPERTSGLRRLLGMAGLALKRKRA